jgi:hypothetical protein
MRTCDVYFVIFCHLGEWRTSYDNIVNTMVASSSMAEILQERRARALQQRAKAGSTGRTGKNATYNAIPSDRILKSWKGLGVFLQEFVENNFGKSSLRRNIREPTYWEKMLGTPPDLSLSESPSVFFSDRDYSFTKVLFYGCERDLLLMNILTYSLFDLWFNNTMTSILLTYLLDYLLCMIRHEWGKVSEL